MKTISNFVYDHPRLTGVIAIVLLVAVLAIGHTLLGERIMGIIFGLCTVALVGWIVFQQIVKD